MLNKISGATPANSPQISQNQPAVRFSLQGSSSSISGKSEGCLSHIFGFITYLWKSFVAFICCGKKEQTKKTEESEETGSSKKTKKKHIEDFELEKPQTDKEKQIAQLEQSLREHLDAFEDLKLRLNDLENPDESTEIDENETVESVQKKIEECEALIKKTRSDLGLLHASTMTVLAVTQAFGGGFMYLKPVADLQSKVFNLGLELLPGGKENGEEFYLALSQLQDLMVIQKTLGTERVNTVLNSSSLYQLHSGMKEKQQALNVALEKLQKGPIILAFNELEKLTQQAAKKNESLVENKNSGKDVDSTKKDEDLIINESLVLMEKQLKGTEAEIERSTKEIQDLKQVLQNPNWPITFENKSVIEVSEEQLAEINESAKKEISEKIPLLEKRLEELIASHKKLLNSLGLLEWTANISKTLEKTLEGGLMSFDTVDTVSRYLSFLGFALTQTNEKGEEYHLALAKMKKLVEIQNTLGKERVNKVATLSNQISQARMPIPFKGLNDLFGVMKNANEVQGTKEDKESALKSGTKALKEKEEKEQKIHLQMLDKRDALNHALKNPSDREAIIHAFNAFEQVVLEASKIVKIESKE